MATIIELYTEIDTKKAEIAKHRNIIDGLSLEIEELEETIDALTELDKQDEAPY